MAEVPFDNLKPNSHKYKEEKENPPKRVTGKVVKGNVLDRNKIGPMKLWRMIFEEDLKTVVKSLGSEILIPKIKDFIFDGATYALGRSIYRDNRAVNRQKGERTSYSSYYVSSGKSVKRQDDPIVEEKQELDYKNMLFETREDADNVIACLIDTIRRYQSASINDLYDSVGKTSDFTNCKYGWTEKDVHLFGVKHVRNGYLLILPTAYTLD